MCNTEIKAIIANILYIVQYIILYNVYMYTVYILCIAIAIVPHPHKSRILDSLPSGSGSYYQQLPLPDGVPSDAPYLVLPRITPTCNIE